MKNSCLPPCKPIQEANVVYQYTCTVGDCSRLNSRYIGVTSKRLTQRLTMHLQNGAIRAHHHAEHSDQLRREHLVNNTIILDRQQHKKRRDISEAVHIHFYKPSINIQQQTLPSLPSLHPLWPASLFEPPWEHQIDLKPFFVFCVLSWFFHLPLPPCFVQNMSLSPVL